MVRASDTATPKKQPDARKKKKAAALRKNKHTKQAVTTPVTRGQRPNARARTRGGIIAEGKGEETGEGQVSDVTL